MILQMIGEMAARRRTGQLTIAVVLAALVMSTLASPAAAARPTCGDRVATIVGTDRGETIVGTARADVIVARGGDDTVRGGGGGDRICGGGGADRLVGDGGPDRLFGDAGPDRLTGGPGDDGLFGGTGADICLQGRGTGPRVDCERTAPRQLVIGGPGSGQVGELLIGTPIGDGFGPWIVGSSPCVTGRIDYGASGTDEYRFAMEFPLSGLPAGARIARAVLAISALTTAPPQSLYAYPGNGSIGASDASPAGQAVGLYAPAAGYQVVDVTSLMTSAIQTAGWAGFLQTRSDNQASTWACRATDTQYPKLTIDYSLP